MRWRPCLRTVQITEQQVDFPADYNLSHMHVALLISTQDSISHVTNQCRITCIHHIPQIYVVCRDIQAVPGQLLSRKPLTEGKTLQQILNAE